MLIIQRLLMYPLSLIISSEEISFINTFYHALRWVCDLFMQIFTAHWYLMLLFAASLVWIGFDLLETMWGDDGHGNV